MPAGAHPVAARHLPVHAAAWALGGVVGAGALALTALPLRWSVLLGAAALCPVVALVTGRLREILLAVIAVDTLFRLDANLFLRPAVGALFGLGGLNLSATTAALAGLYAAWFAELAVGRRHLPAHLSATALPAAACLGAASLSVLVAGDTTLALFGVAMLAQAFLLFLYIVGTVDRRGDPPLLIGLLCAVAALQGLALIGVYLTGAEFEAAGLRFGVLHGRASGTLGSPNETGGAMALLMGPAAGLLLAPVPRPYRLLAGAALALGATAVLLTFSRGAWVSVAVTGAVVGLAAWHRRWLPGWLPGLALAMGLAVGLFFHEPIAARLLGDDLGSAQSRVPLMALAFDLIRDHPVLGVGINNYATWMFRYAVEDGWTWVAVVHDKYLLVWAETGVVGLAAFIWFLAAALARGWACWQRRDPLLSPLALGLAAGVAGRMVHMFVDIFASPALVQGLWLVAGLLAALCWLEPQLPGEGGTGP